MKVDVQGADLAVLSAAGSELQRVDEVSMEVLNDACDGMYDGQPNCSTIVRTMRSLGFLTLKSCSAPGTFHRFQGFGCERDFLFYRAERGPPAPAARGARKRAGGGGRSRRAVVARGAAKAPGSREGQQGAGMQKGASHHKYCLIHPWWAYWYFLRGGIRC